MKTTPKLHLTAPRKTAKRPAAAKSSPPSMRVYCPNEEIKQKIRLAAMSTGRTASAFLLWLFREWEKRK